MTPLPDHLNPSEHTPEPLTVGDLTLLIKGTLDMTFDDVWVVGEISNLSRPRSGHCYLTLKDATAQLPAVVWRSSASRIRFDLADGQLVVCHGRIDVYPPHGKYQLVIDTLEPLGQGGLELAFRQLHAKLEAEGLFAPERKRPIPTTVRRVAVVTSPTGAAVRDFLQVMARRTRRIDVLIVPVRVQGDGASAEIAAAIKMINQVGQPISQGGRPIPQGGRPISERPRCRSEIDNPPHTNDNLPNTIDCIVVTRGGGSLEDLWAFNEETLVRAVAESRIPVISAIGHEIDVTLCDLAADLRALTPSEAAERISPNDAELAETLAAMQRFLDRGMTQKMQLAAQRLARFRDHPVFVRSVETLVFPVQKTLDHLDTGLQRGIKMRLDRAAVQLGTTAATLEALSPLAVLGRGYSMTFDRNNKLLTNAANLREDDEITTRFVDGTVRSIVRVGPIQAGRCHLP